jgi:hypothetical protein
MVLSWLVRQLLMYGGLVLAAVAVVVIVRLRHRIRQRWLRWLPPLAIPIGLVLFYWSYTHRFEYVIVRDGDHGPTITRRYSADRIPEVSLAPGVHPPTESFGSEPVWVINLSQRIVHVRSVQYGRSLAIDNSPTVIPPNTSAHFVHIDHIGPRDIPPAEVNDDVNIGIAFREWLTWDE